MSLQHNSRTKPSPWQLLNRKASGASVQQPSHCSPARPAEKSPRCFFFFAGLSSSVLMAGSLSPPHPLPAAPTA